MVRSSPQGHFVCPRLLRFHYNYLLHSVHLHPYHLYTKALWFQTSAWLRFHSQTQAHHHHSPPLNIGRASCRETQTKTSSRSSCRPEHIELASTRGHLVS